MHVQRQVIDGIAEWTVDGRPLSRAYGCADMPAYNAPEKVDQFREAGINVFLTELFDPFMFCWDGADEHYFDHYEAHIDRLIQARPDIRLILFIGSRQGAPYRWARRNPGELALLSDGTRKTTPSLASDLWLKESTQAIRRAVEHFERGPYAGHILGYNLTMLGTEWLTKLGNSDRVEDYSAPMQRHFRSWLREAYGGDVARLRARWKNPEVTFETAAVPTFEERFDRGRKGFFAYCEEHGFKIADYHRCYDERCADVVIHYGKAVKEGCEFRKLACVWYGYSFLYPHGAPYPHGHGHGCSERVFKSEYIDSFSSPYSYYNRCLGGVHYAQNAVDSILMRGKLYADQLDLKTHVKAMPNTNARSPWETEQLLKQCGIYALSKNAHQYWYDINVGCYAGMTSPVLWERNHFDDPAISKLIARLKVLADDNQAARPARVDEVAFFTSHQGHYYRRYEGIHANFYTEAIRSWFLAYTGCPYAEYNLEDFADVKTDYKVYLFPDAWWVPAAQRATIRRRIEEQGATAVFFHAPGYVDDDGCSPENCAALTGLRLVKEEAEDWHQVEIMRFDHPYTAGLKAGSHPSIPPGAFHHPGPLIPNPRWPVEFGSDCDPEYFRKSQEWFQWITWGQTHGHERYRFPTRFHADDPDATVLGVLRGTDRGGLVVKPLGRGTVVYSAAPCPPSELLMNIFRASGVHLYSDTTDIVYANARYLGLCAHGDGTRTLRLPGAGGAVRDALTGEIVGRGPAVTVQARHGEVRLFLRE